MSATAVLLVVLAAAALPFLPLDGVAAPGRSRPAWPSPYLLLLGALAFFGLLVEGAIADWTSVFLHSNLQLSPGCIGDWPWCVRGRHGSYEVYWRLARGANLGQVAFDCERTAHRRWRRFVTVM